MKKSMKPRLMSYLVVSAMMAISGSLLFARTEVTVVDKELQELRAAMLAFERQYHEFPSGDDSSMIASLSKIGLRVPARRLGGDGSYLDPWGNPYHFFNSGDMVVILSLGEKIADGFPSPKVILVKATAGQKKMK